MVALRPVEPDDKPLLEAGMARLSPTSRRLRFMAPVDTLTRAQLAYLTEIDHHNHVAWGVLVDDQPVAVARMVRLTDDPAAAELAIIVVDEYQRRGIARLLISVMAELARALSIERFAFEALPENEAILGLLAGLGATYGMSEGVIEGSLDLAHIPAPALSGDPLSLALGAQELTDARLNGPG
ncbi:MAG: GNAT family N-acetyltransferase [Acidimicrobiia bacterium]